MAVSDSEPRRSELAVVFDTEADASAAVLSAEATDQEIAAELFLRGCLINWKTLYPNGTGTLLTLPPYPFARTAHWLPLTTKD